MLLTNNFLAGIVLLIILAGCQKEISSQLPVMPVTPAGDSTLLGKYVVLDTTLPAPLDTSWTATYEYDNLKRIKRIYYFDYTGGLPDPVSGFTEYSYNGSSTNIVSEYTRNYYLGNVEDSSIHYYTYNSNGNIIKDSLIDYINGINSRTKNYSYGNNSVITDFNNGDFLYTFLTLANNNITGQTDSLVQGGTMVNYYVTTITYDNNPQD